jgi:hypothetical protein
MTTPNYSGSTSSGQFGNDAADTSATTTDGGAKQEAQQQAKQVAGTAADQSKHVAGVAKDQAQNVAAEAKYQARGLVDEAKAQVDEQSRTQKDRLANTLRTFSDDLEQMASKSDQSGMAADLARQVASKAKDVSSHLENHDPSDLLDDVRDFARRKPGMFLLGAAAAGMVAGRLARGAKEAKGNSDSSRSGYSQSGYSGSQGGYAGTQAGVYDTPSGTASGLPTAGVGYPAADPAYPVESNVGIGEQGYSEGWVEGDAPDPNIGLIGGDVTARPVVGGESTFIEDQMGRDKA